MTRILKKNTKGKNSKFISRAKAIKKLGLSIKDFRKLCILKGVHPREPTKKLGKVNTVYYHDKDIKYLQEDKAIEYFQINQIYKRKLRKAIVRKDLRKVQELKESKPALSINHIVKERYTNFEDALKDLDDCLSTLALFSSLPSHRLFKVDPERIKISRALVDFFKIYVVSKGCLEKVFLAVNGVYYQAKVEGQTIVWMEPYSFTSILPFDVDYKVILTFQEFYQTMMKFTLFRLYKSEEWAFPPVQVSSEKSE